MKSGSWCDIESAELERLHADGLKPAEIGRHLDRTVPSVKAKLKRMGLVFEKSWAHIEPMKATPRHGDYTPAQRERMNSEFVCAMVAAGYARFSANGPPDIVFREPIWRGAA